MVVRIGKKEYFIAKYVAVFLTGGCAMIIPLLFNFVLTAMLVPAVTPLVNYDVYYAVFGESLMSTLYYTEPFLYIFLYLCIDFVYGGLLAGICFTASIVLKQKWSVVLSPFFVCMVIHFMRRFIYISSMTIYKEISPIFFLRPARAAYDADKWIMLGMALIIFIITFFVNISRERKHEIY